jgi:tagaturonate reductase
MKNPPETFLQFGTGNFLRAFADLFIEQANLAGQNVGKVVAVQSTDSNRASSLDKQGMKYHVLIRGRLHGREVDQCVSVSSISRALAAKENWETILAVARSRDLRCIISNATESGLKLDPADSVNEKLPTGCPKSFPAKLTLVIHERFKSRLPGLTILPCELVDNNAKVLLGLCKQQAAAWKLPAEFLEYLANENHWLSTLVDRIVPGKPAEHPLLAEDAMLTVAEPYAFWAIETNDPALIPFQHESIHVVADVGAYSLRKIRILNGMHTALVAKALPLGIATVREAVADARVRSWLLRLIDEEIIPTLEGRVDSPKLFAEQCLERFSNPMIHHKLADIAVNHETKLKTRLAPTHKEFTVKFGKNPPLLSEILGEAK